MLQIIFEANNIWNVFRIRKLILSDILLILLAPGTTAIEFQNFIIVLSDWEHYHCVV